MKKTTLLRDRKALKRLVEQYGKKDVLNFVRHLNESVNDSRYTSLQIADLMDNYYDNYYTSNDNALEEVTRKIAAPWNAALKLVNLEPGINLLQDLEAEDVRDSGYFYMGVDSQAYYMGIYDGLDYNGIETEVSPGIRIDERGNICPFIAKIIPDIPNINPIYVSNTV